MAQISVEKLYRGESGSAKYGAGGIMGAVMKDFLLHGVPEDYDEQTWIEMLFVKHTLAAAEKMKNEGDFISEVTEAEPPSYHGEGRDENS